MSPPFDLHPTLGAIYIGMVVAASLYGVSILQALYYYTHQNDRWPIKLLVAAVMLFDTVHQALITNTVYSYAITNWGSPEQLGILARSLLIEVLFNGLTSFLVQSFLTMRLWRLSNGNKLLTGFAAVLVLAELVSQLVFTALALPFNTFAQLLTLRPLSLTVNVLAAAGDVLIAGALCALLHKSRTGLRRSDTIINRLILFAVNTGLVTSLFAVASFVSYMAAPNTFIYIAFYFCTGRLYSNSLLATLNARKIIRNSSGIIHNSSTNKVTLSLRDLPKIGSSSSRGDSTNISIKVHTTQESDLVHEREDHECDKIETSSSSAIARFKEDDNV